MKRISLIALFLFTSFSFAQEKTETTASVNDDQNQIEEAVEIPVLPKRSYDHRDKKKLELLAKVGLDYTSMGSGITVGYYLDRQSILELSYFSGDEDSTDEDKDEKVKVVSLGTKFFSGNSFYMNPALFYVDYKYNYDSELTSSSRQFKRADLGLSFRIGNQWQWENFTIGCDWIGIQYGVDNIHRSGRKGGFIPSVKDQSRWVSATVLNLSIGASF